MPSLKGKNNPNYTHGIGHCRLYRIYSNMKQRCNNPKNHKYEMYGARGIKVCDEWNDSHGLKTFYDWAMANGYSDELTLDRIDTNGNYEPSNCRWVTAKEQSENTRRNLYVVCYGERITSTEFERRYKISRSFLKKWLNRGLTPEEIIAKHSDPECGKDKGGAKIAFNGETLSYRQWGNKMNIRGGIIRDRVSKGWDIEKAITTPCMRKRKVRAT